MSDIENGPNILVQLLEDASVKAEGLARQRCSNAVCGLSGVLMECPSGVTKRVIDSDMSWVENIVHGIGCEFDAECHFANNPHDVTTVFTQALEQALNESGLVGIIDSPQSKGVAENN